MGRVCADDFQVYDVLPTLPDWDWSRVVVVVPGDRARGEGPLGDSTDLLLLFIALYSR
jgi:hypothetical protein